MEGDTRVDAHTTYPPWELLVMENTYVGSYTIIAMQLLATRCPAIMQCLEH
jgi:hypothetical protein